MLKAEAQIAKDAEKENIKAIKMQAKAKAAEVKAAAKAKLKKVK